MSTRADFLTQTQKQQDLFSDFVDSFAMSPFGNQVGKVTNNQAITQSLKNIILTEMGERPFQPYIGSQIANILFDPMSFSSLNAEFLIKTAIKNNEPRVEVFDVTVSEQENSLAITITYRPINSIDTQNFNFILKRVR